MAETTTRRHNPFRAFWPWPGTALFLLVSLWLFYMAWMASAPDLQKAFAGLGALMFLLSLFGLRSRRRAPPAAAEQVAPLPATHRRSNIADDVGAAGTPPPAEPVAGRMPRNARMRREAEAPQPVTSTTTAHSVEADEQKDATPETDPVAEVADDADAEPVGAAVTAETMSPLPPMTLERLVAQVQSLESQINREKAERGAQFAQLDTRIGAAGTADAAASEDASASANTLDAGALDERLSQFLTINAFNDVMNKKVLQRISALIDNKIAEATKPETLRERIGDLVAPAATTAPADGGGDQEALRSELAALRESLSAAVAEVRDTADSAAKLANRAVSESGEGPLRRNVKALREETAKLNEAVEEAKKAAAGAAGTAVTEAQAAVREALAGVETRVDERLSQATDGFDALRGNVSAVLEHISRMDGEFKKVLSLVEAIGHAPPAGKGEAGASPSVGAEVEALRDALTTIIAQNREIREKQDVLTARFDPPVRVRAERFED